MQGRLRHPTFRATCRWQGWRNPGHSWLFVHLFHVATYGACEKISGFSHIVGAVAALEEDCDAPAFADEYEKSTGNRLDLDDSGSVSTKYDALFEWDHAYSSFAKRSRTGAGAGAGAGGIGGSGEERILKPYDAATAARLGRRSERGWRMMRCGM